MTNQLKTFLLLGLLSALLIGFGSTLGPGYVWVFLIISLVMNVGAYFYSDKMVLMMSGAKEVSELEAPALHRMVAELAMRAGIPKPKVCIIPSEQPNAFATGRNPSKGVVAASTGIMRALTERELRGVMAHEIAHIKHRDILVASIASVMASAISSVANVVQWGAIFGGSGRSEDREGSGASSLAFALLAPIGAFLIQMGISRSREYMADAYGAKLCGDPEALASALEKLHHYAERIPSDAPAATASLYIVNPFSGIGGMMHLFSTHPPMEKRIAELRKMVLSPLRLQTAF